MHKFYFSWIIKPMSPAFLVTLTDPSSKFASQSPYKTLILCAFEVTFKLDCVFVETDIDGFYALSTATSSGSGGVSQFNITNAGSGYTENDVLTENSGVNGAGTDCQLTFARTPATFIQGSAGTGTENDPYTGQRSQESFASSDNLLPTVNGGARSRGFIDLTILDGGSGFADSSDVTFSGTDITGSSGTGLSFRAVVLSLIHI